MLVQFIDNKDNITITMLIDHQIIEDEVPYVPSKFMDHRGLYLFYFCKENDVNWDELQFEPKIENFSEVMRGFHYMFNPYYVAEAINDREYAKQQYIKSKKQVYVRN